MDLWNSTVFILFILFMVVAGLLKSKWVKSENQYLLANRNTRLFALVATLVMTEFNTATLIAFSGLGYAAGWWALTLPFIFLLGLIFYALTVAKRWKEFNGISVAHYFTVRYGPDIAYGVSLILFVAMLGFSAVYVKSLTLIFYELFPWLNSWLISGGLVILMLLMTLRGGLIAIIRTDVISFLMMLIFFPLVIYFVGHTPTIQSTHLNLIQMQHTLPPQFIISLILLTMFSYILAPWYGQKMVAADSTKTAYCAVFIASLCIFFLYGGSIFAAALLRYKGISLPQPELALPYIIHTILPTKIRGLAYALLFSIAATTLAGVWSAMVTLLRGSLPYQVNKPLSFTMLLLFLCALFSYLGANILIDRILNKMILMNIPIVALSFALLAGFYWPKASRGGVYLSVIMGLIWGIGCYFLYGEKGFYTWYWAVYGIPIIFIAGIVGSLLLPTSKHSVIRVQNS